MITAEEDVCSPLNRMFNTMLEEMFNSSMEKMFMPLLKNMVDSPMKHNICWTPA
jgi:hypothetical protein